MNTPKRFAIVAVVVLTSALMPAGAAQTSLDCGDVVKEDVQLSDSLLNCPDDGLVVGASKITIDLDGHRIDGRGDGSGVLNEKGFKDVVVRDGTISGFDHGVQIDSPSSTQNTIEDLLFDDNDTAISLEGADRNVIQDNELSGNDDGIEIEGDDNVIVDNEIFDEAPAVAVEGDDNVIEKNEIIYAAAGDKGSAIVFDGDTNLVLKNDVLAGEDGIDGTGEDNVIDNNDLEAGAGDGIVVEGAGNDVVDNSVKAYGDRCIVVAEDDSTGNIVADNDVKDCGDEGILVKAELTRVDNNDVEDNGADGIQVDGDNSRVVDNDADDNGFGSGKGYGILAGADGVEGSGNDADGNANSNECKPSSLCH